MLPLWYPHGMQPRAAHQDQVGPATKGGLVLQHEGEVAGVLVLRNHFQVHLTHFPRFSIHHLPSLSLSLHILLASLSITSPPFHYHNAFSSLLSPSPPYTFIYPSFFSDHLSFLVFLSFSLLFLYILYFRLVFMALPVSFYQSLDMSDVWIQVLLIPSPSFPPLHLISHSLPLSLFLPLSPTLSLGSNGPDSGGAVLAHLRPPRHPLGRHVLRRNQ